MRTCEGRRSALSPSKRRRQFHAIVGRFQLPSAEFFAVLAGRRQQHHPPAANPRIRGKHAPSQKSRTLGFCHLLLHQPFIATRF